MLSSLFVIEEKRAKRDKGAARTRQKRPKKQEEDGERRGIEAGTSLLSVPNEEERAGIIIKKPH